jgi:formate/nitrite transporter FocA (FNT family)
VDWEEVLGRVGLVAKGVSYGLVGVLAAGVAVGAGGKATSRQGALHDLAGTTFGTFLLVLLIIGFVAYAAWRVLQAVTVRESDEKKAWGKRVAYLARAAVYGSLAFSAGRILAGAGGGQSQNQKAHKATAVVLSWPGGTWLVGIAGAVLIGVGVWNLVRGLSRKFEDKWRGGMSPTGKTWGGRAGVVGHVARFIVFTLIGVFAIKAAADYNPKDSVGLDGALQKLAHQSYGSFLLGLTAAGLIAYAIYCFFDARYRDLTQ